MIPDEIKLGDTVVIDCSGEFGTVIGTAQYIASEDTMLIRYRAGDGRAVESWWPVSAISKKS